MSALLDNLTTIIVLVALLRKQIDDKQTRWFFASMVVLVAGAMEMYPIMEAGVTGYDAFFAQDGAFWEFLAILPVPGAACLLLVLQPALQQWDWKKLTLSGI
jgi:hypothetical protein